MKYLFGFMLSLILAIVLRFTNLDLFLIGWFSCMGWYVTILLYDDIKDAI